MKRIGFLLFICLNMFVFSQEKTVISIPTNYTDMYLYKNLEEGKYQGVYVDLFNSLNKDNLNNKNIEYILSDSKDSDLILRTIETKEGKDKYLYINTPFVYRIAIVVNKDSKIKNIGELKELKVAYIPSEHGLKEIEERYNWLKLDKIQVRTVDEGLNYLKNGTVDAFVVKDWNEKNSGESNYKALENIKYNEQVAVKKENLKLYEEINEGVNGVSSDSLKNILNANRIGFYKYLLEDTPSYEDVKEKYKELKVRLGKDKYQLPFYYKRGDKYHGLTINIVNEIQKIIGIPVVYVTDGDYDIDGIAIENKKGQEKYSYTKPYYEMKLSVANRKSGGFIYNISDLDNSKVIVLKNDYSETYLKKVVKNIEIIEVNTYEQGLEDLLNKKGDYLVGYLGGLTGAISNSFLDDKIKVAGILNETFGVSLATKKVDESLTNVVDTITDSFTIDKSIVDNDLLKNSIVTQNYKLMLKIGIPVFIFIIILIIAIIRSEKNRKKAEDLSYSLVEVLEMANQLNDEDTGDHVRRIGLYSTLLAEKMRLSNKVIGLIARFASLHDIGKVAIPSEILKKPSKLTEDEFDKVKGHVEIGYKLVKKLQLGSVAENIVRYHHEKWDGTGYPHGIKGEDIPVESRIVSLVDVYDALRQDKFHRKGISHKETLKIILKDRGTFFDPKIVDVFLENESEFEKIYENNKDALHLATEFYTAIKK